MKCIVIMTKYIGLLLLCTMLSGCTRLFFFPMTQHVTTPAQLGYQYEDVYFESADGVRLHAWLIEPKAPQRGTVYFLHGNAENISTHFRATVWLLESGYRVFALDYRGYGLSEGKPDVPEVFSDIEAGAQWLAKQDDSALPVFMLGQSLGASLAIKFASLDTHFEQRFDGLITEAAFARYDTIAQHIASKHWLTWAAAYPAKWLIGRQYDPLDAIAELDGIPKLLIHSTDDEIIPYRFGEALYRQAAEPKTWITATGPHIRAAAEPAVRQGVLAFMQRVATQETQPVQ